MKRRLAVLLVMALLLCNMMPINTFADGEESIEIDVYDWEKLQLYTTGSWKLGHYKHIILNLKADIETKSPMEIKMNIIIHGEGHKLTPGYGYNRECFKVYNKAGVLEIDNLTISEYNYVGVAIGPNGKMIMYSGSIENNSNYTYAGGVEVNNGSTFDMYGGRIANNHTDMYGGGVVVGRNSVFNMYGGKITGNSAEKQGGGVSIDNEDATFNMYDGIISGNTAKSEGGGVVQWTAPSLATKFIMTGGSITGNTADKGGGYSNTNTDFEQYAEFTMTGGSITGNTANKGGGIYKHEKSTSTINISGPAKVAENNAKDAGDDIYNEGGSGLEIPPSYGDEKDPWLGWYEDDDNKRYVNSIASTIVSADNQNEDKINSNDSTAPYGLKAVWGTRQRAEVNGTVTWNDNNDAEDMRPISVVIVLKDQNNKQYVTQFDPQQDNYIDWDQSGTNIWRYTVKELPFYDRDGVTELTYTVEAEKIQGYKVEINGNNIKYTRDVPVVKPSTPVATPSNPVNPGNPIATPSDPIINPGNPIATPSDPIINPGNPIATPSNPIATPSSPTTSGGGSSSSSGGTGGTGLSSAVSGASATEPENISDIETPLGSLPKTGDRGQLLLWFIFMSSLMTILRFIWTMRKEKYRAEN